MDEAARTTPGPPSDGDLSAPDSVIAVHRDLEADDGQTLDAADVIDADRRDVVVVYDFRRYQTSTVQRATELAAAGAHIACITDEWLSPVAQAAEVVLPTAVRSTGAFDSAGPLGPAREAPRSATAGSASAASRAGAVGGAVRCRAPAGDPAG